MSVSSSASIEKVNKLFICNSHIIFTKSIYSIKKSLISRLNPTRNIEAHNERTKEKYASNPDVDTSRSKYNFHLVKPPSKYRAESERQIAAAGCRTRKDSIRMIETLFTASPEFFNGKKQAEIRGFFEEALHFLEQQSI